MIKDEFFKNRKSIYLPALSASAAEGLMKDGKSFNGQSYRFYNSSPDSEDFYNALLVSSGHYYKKLDTTKKMGIDLDKTFVMGDSGGYQLATGYLTFSNDIVEKIFNWLEHNSNYAMNLDLPPYVSRENKKRISEDFFNKRLEQSVKNFEYFMKNRTGKVRYLNILHGRKRKHLTTWYDAVKDFDFDGGWSLGSVSSNLFYILQSFFLLKEMGEFERLNKKKIPTIIHILGFSKVYNLYYISYLQKKLKDYGYDNITITYDSSSPALTAAYGNYIFSSVLRTFKYLVFSNKYDYKDVPKGVPLPCECPFCRNVTFDTLFTEGLNSKGGFSTQLYNLICFHNLYKVLELKKKIDRIVDFDNYDFQKQFFGKTDALIFEAISEAFKKDKPFEFIRNMYSNITNGYGNIKIGDAEMPTFFD
jgi:hypothetical protein